MDAPTLLRVGQKLVGKAGHGAGTAILAVKGKPGNGKTEIAGQIAKALNRPLDAGFSGVTMSPLDVNGCPEIIGAEGHRVTTYCPTDIFPWENGKPQNRVVKARQQFALNRRTSYGRRFRSAARSMCS